MPPTFAFVQAATNNGAASSVVQAFAANVTAGNLLIAAFASETDTATFTSLSDTLGSTWNQVAVAQTVATKWKSFGIYWAVAGTSAADSITAAMSAGWSDLAIAEYSVSAGYTWALDQHSENSVSGGGATVTSNAVTTTAADELLVGFAVNNRSVLTATGGFTRRTGAVGNAAWFDLADQIVAATGSYAFTGTITSGGSWSAHLATFTATASGGGSPTVLPMRRRRR